MAALGQMESTARSSVRTQPTLDIAARSILESQALVGSVASVVAGRALDHHWESLFQYAAVRVGGGAAAELLFAHVTAGLALTNADFLIGA